MSQPEARDGDETTRIGTDPGRATHLVDGRLASSDARSALLRLATRLIVEDALEAEVEDALGRGYYEHGAAAGAGYRSGRLKTAEEPIGYAAPQVAQPASAVPLGAP